jgi:hypothetical protein
MYYSSPTVAVIVWPDVANDDRGHATITCAEWEVRQAAPAF